MHQDQCEDRPSWLLLHIPDGQGRDVATDISGDRVADHLAESATGVGMKEFRSRKMQITFGEMHIM
jgi:hypothetical protein